MAIDLILRCHHIMRMISMTQRRRISTFVAGNQSVIENTRSHRDAIAKGIIRVTVTIETRVELSIMNHVDGVTETSVTLLISILIDHPLMIIEAADRIFTVLAIAMAPHRRIYEVPVALRLKWVITVIHHHQDGQLALLLTSRIIVVNSHHIGTLEDLVTMQMIVGRLYLIEGVEVFRLKFAIEFQITEMIATCLPLIVTDEVLITFMIAFGLIETTEVLSIEGMVVALCHRRGTIETLFPKEIVVVRLLSHGTIAVRPLVIWEVAVHLITEAIVVRR